MTDKLNQEIKIKAKQVTEDLINFMQDLDTENNYQIKELKKDIEYYKSHIEELETENKLAKEIIRDLSKSLFLAKGLIRDLCDDTVDFRESKERALYCYNQEHLDGYKKAEAFLKE